MNSLTSPHFPLGTTNQSLIAPSIERSITHLNFQIIAFPWFNKQQVDFSNFFLHIFM